MESKKDQIEENIKRFQYEAWRTVYEEGEEVLEDPDIIYVDVYPGGNIEVTFLNESCPMSWDGEASITMFNDKEKALDHIADLVKGHSEVISVGKEDFRDSDTKSIQKN